MSSLEQERFREESSPNELRPGEEAVPYIYSDGNGDKLVRFYVNRNGKDYILPGEPRKPTEAEIEDFEKRQVKNGDQDSNLPLAA